MQKDYMRSAEDLRSELDKLARLEEIQSYVASNLASLKIRVKITGNEESSSSTILINDEDIDALVRDNLPEYVEQMVRDQEKKAARCLARLSAQMSGRKTASAAHPGAYLEAVAS